jgi:predicted enzyme related to lactoylglutathione lyase
MTIRDTAFAPGTPCWVDLLSSDVDKSVAFYSGVFGWKAQAAAEEFGGYITLTSDDHPVAGLMGRMPGMDSPDAWSTYVSTQDIEATFASATATGASVIAAPMAVGDIGSMAILVDPAGAAFGLWQPATFFGFGKYNEPNSVTWDEIHSKDFSTTVSFYTSLFGWSLDKTSDSDEFRYYQGQIDGNTVAGMMDSHAFLPPDVPSHWAVYFSVVDTDAAVARAVELGATVVRPPEDTPFGRIADLSDPTGAQFKLHSSVLADAGPAAANP